MRARVTAALVMVMGASVAWAERAPVVDSMPMGGAAQEMRVGNVPPAEKKPYYGPSTRANPQTELLYQLDLLQQEVQNLRGQLEQYSRQINQLQEDGTNRYRGLDQRVTSVEQSLQSKPAVAAQPAINPQMFLDNPEMLNDPRVLDALDNLAQPQGAAVAPAVSEPAVVEPAPVAPAAVPPVLPGASSQVEPQALPDDEQEAYELTRELIKRREFPLAASTLQSFISKFPGGQYEGHAWYWLGEVFMVLPDAEAAKTAFQHLLGNFPAHVKEPDATYKLAVVHDQMGNPTEARTYFKKVIAEHDGTAAASLAENYMRFMSSPDGG